MKLASLKGGRDGRLVVPDRPGWGIDPIEEVIHAHPPKDNVGLYAAPAR